MDMKSLGMIITSDRYPEQVWSLVRTATAKKLDVRIHLTGPGVRLIQWTQFRKLLNQASITICTESAASHLAKNGLDCDYRHCFAHAGQINRLLEECDRHIVF